MDGRGCAKDESVCKSLPQKDIRIQVSSFRHGPWHTSAADRCAGATSRGLAMQAMTSSLPAGLPEARDPRNEPMRVFESRSKARQRNARTLRGLKRNAA